MHLTKKQKLIWKLIAHGYSNKEICDYCFIELSTVNTHIKAIYQYLGLPTMGRGATNRIRAANCYWIENIEELKKFNLISKEISCL